MSTNFYVNADPTCNNPAHTETLHIGQQAGGWKFLFHGIPDRGLTSWKEWRKFLKNRRIVNENNRIYTLAEFEKEVLPGIPNRRTGQAECRITPADTIYHDAEGYDIYDGSFS